MILLINEADAVKVVMQKSILVVDDSQTVCLMLKSWLSKKNYLVDIASGAEDAKSLVRDNFYDLILSDIQMPGLDGLSFLSWVKRYDSDISVIMMTSYSDVDTAVESMKMGATDYISKPIEPDKLYDKIDEAIAKQEKDKDKMMILNKILVPPGKENQMLVYKLNDIVESKQYTLILGDRGTGKSSYAKYIFDKAIGDTLPYVVYDASDMLKKESGTAGNGSTGLKDAFDKAKGGMLYVSSFDKMSSLQQNDLLSCMTKQSRGDEFTSIVMSSERSLSEIKEGVLPKLYDIITENVITLPSLKDTPEDILFYSYNFVKLANNILNKDVKRIDKRAEKELVEFDWPGNIQQLKNAIFSAVISTDGDTIMSPVIGAKPKVAGVESADDVALNIKNLRKEHYEKDKISKALELSKGNKTLAASLLNIDRKTLYNKIKLYDVKLPN
ncbi:MAG: sigma-54-dependent transcriptional regulator [Fermentimonas sp.]